MTVIPGPAQPARVRRRAIHPLAAVLAASLLVGAPATLGAQQTGLSKSELVRLIVSSVPDAEKLSTIRSRCLSFEPTERDWADLRGLGASEAMISAAQQCSGADELDETVTVTPGRGEPARVRITVTPVVSPARAVIREALSPTVTVWSISGVRPHCCAAEIIASLATNPRRSAQSRSVGSKLRHLERMVDSFSPSGADETTSLTSSLLLSPVCWAPSVAGAPTRSDAASTAASG